MADIQYDLELFLQLNQEYKGRPIVPKPRNWRSGNARLAAARRWAAILEERVGIRGTSVLEIGCGRGDMAYVLAVEYGCNVTALDVKRYETWNDYTHEQLKYRLADVGGEHHLRPGFDRIVSLVVFEHIEHPYATLRGCHELLAENGVFYLRANLYRGVQASHRYREVLFPWPHLLFSDDVFQQFYMRKRGRPARPAWVNKLTYAHYLLYFRQLGFCVEKEWFSRREIDEDFYRRFVDVLGRYPRWDLEVDFFDVVLRKESAVDRNPRKRSGGLARKAKALLRRVRSLPSRS